MIDLNIEEIANIPYPRLLRGNHSRRHDVQMAHALDDEGKLEGTNVRELATLRCHSVSTVSKSYDVRNKVVRAARAAQALRKSANRAFGIADCQTDKEEEEEEVSTWGAGDSELTPNPEITGELGLTASAWEGAGDGEDASEDDSVLDTLPCSSGQRKFREVYSSSDEESTAAALQLQLNDTEEETGLKVDEHLLPFLRDTTVQRGGGHRRTGVAWSRAERATLGLAPSKKIFGKRSDTTLEDRVEEFPRSRPGWDMKKRGVKIFIAQLYKCRT